MFFALFIKKQYRTWLIEYFSDIYIFKDCSFVVQYICLKETVCLSRINNIIVVNLG